MTKRSQIYWAYIQMALGLSFVYTNEMAQVDFAALDAGASVGYEAYIWTGSRLRDQICAARGISRERFVRSLAAPKPSSIQHWIFCEEIEKHFGEKFDIEFPKGRGIVIPTRAGHEITDIRFYPLSKVLRPKRDVAKAMREAKNGRLKTGG